MRVIERIFILLSGLLLSACTGGQEPSPSKPEITDEDVIVSVEELPVYAGTADALLATVKVGTKTSSSRLEELLFSAGEMAESDVLEYSLWTQDNTYSRNKKICTGDLESGIVHFSLSGNPYTYDNRYCICASLKEQIHPGEPLHLVLTSVRTTDGTILTGLDRHIMVRKAVVVRDKGMDGVHTSRIPALATSNSGALIAIFDARYDSDRDLQGDIDIAMHRSTDGGATWSPMQVIIDMGKYGGLPERFNGVSDAGIVVDKNTGEIFVFTAWMHGIIDPSSKTWLTGIDESTDLNSVWQHHWTKGASLQGWGVRETTQFVMVSSKDDGQTWSEPVSITGMLKPYDYYLLCPCPSQGITMSDGTLVLAVAGIDNYGDRFGSIMLSEDHGETWRLAPRNAYSDGGEGTVAELSNGVLMYNTHLRSNAGLSREEGNGRGVVTTSDKGKTWKLHPSDHTLIEPPCEGSLLNFEYEQSGNIAHALLFFNPHSCTGRVDLSLQVSLDEGLSWPEDKLILIEKGPCWGYSCMTQVDATHVGILYESSVGQISFIQLGVDDFLREK